VHEDKLDSPPHVPDGHGKHTNEPVTFEKNPFMIP
jgi:hypothetical protein